MTITEAHYDFKIKQNRIDSLSNIDFNPAQVDWLLNEAQIIFVKQRFGTTNNKRKGFDSTQKRIDDLSTLVIQYPTQPRLVPTLIEPGVYELSLNKLSYPYLFLIAGQAQAESDDCVLTIPLRSTQHDDLKSALRDPFNEPSSEWLPYNIGRSVADNTVSSIFIFSGDIIVNTVELEYIKIPLKVSLGSYTYIDGTTYSPQTFETPEQTHSEIVDIAVTLAHSYSNNPELTQLSSQKFLINE